MLEGMLNDEQTAEVLHRLSVSPEKLSAFRQHMALRGAFEADVREGELSAEEDDAVWAAVLGATGGLVTGGTAVGASGWLAKAAAFVVTGLAGFFIGTAVDGTLLTSEDEPVLAENTQQVQAGSSDISPLQQTSPALQSIVQGTLPRVDTVVQTVVKYRDRVEYKYIERPAGDEGLQEIAAENSTNTSSTTATRIPDNNGTDNETPTTTLPSSSGHNRYPNLGISRDALAALQGMNRNTAAAQENQIATDMAASEQTSPDPIRNTIPSAEKSPVDPNKELAIPTANRSSTDPDETLPEEREASALSLMRNGFEIGYSERFGRITALPKVRDEGEPSYGGRALELTGRMLEGKVGLGARLIYGSFATVTLKEEIQNIGVADIVLIPTLESTPEFNVEVFAGYRIPLFGERLALGLEGSFGLSSSRFKVGGDVLATWLITRQIGIQGGIGYGAYRYTTQQKREGTLSQYENVSISDEFIDFYEGSIIEGRYGLFYKF